jgi:SAM-dependent methyltransferase
LARLYDRLVGDAAFPELRRAIALRLREHDRDPRTILDIGCGTGRMLAALAVPGRQLTGLDRSPTMLRRARMRLGERARLICADMRNFRIDQPVDLALCNFATVNYLLEEQALAAAFGCMAQALRPGGLLILDYIPHRPSIHDPGIEERAMQVPGGGRWQVRIDHRRGRTHTRIALPVGRSETHVQQWHRPATIGRILRDAALRPAGSHRLGAGGPTDWVQCVAVRDQ